MPLELHSIWVQYPWTLGDLACDAKIVLMEAIIYSSILTIVAFSFERYYHANKANYFELTLVILHVTPTNAVKRTSPLYRAVSIDKLCAG